MNSDVRFELSLVRKKLNEQVVHNNLLVIAIKKLIHEFSEPNLIKQKQDVIDEANRLVHTIETGGL